MKYLILIITALLSVSVLMSCSEVPKVEYEPKTGNGHKINVIVSVPPLKEFVEAVGGDYVQVSYLRSSMDNLKEPLTLEEESALSNADLFFALGTFPFEKELTQQLNNPDLKVVDLSEAVSLRNYEEDWAHLPELDLEEDENEVGIPENCADMGGKWLPQHNECENIAAFHCKLLEGEFLECESACRHIPGTSFCTDMCVKVCKFSDELVHPELYEDEPEQEEVQPQNSGVDPYIWLSPGIASQQITGISDELIQVDPDHEPIYKKNAREYQERLSEMDSSNSKKLQGLQGKPLIVYDPAYGYLADHYGLEQVSIKQAGGAPSKNQLERIKFLAEKENVKDVVSYQESRGNEYAAQLGGSVIVIDPLAEDYIANLANAADKISQITS